MSEPAPSSNLAALTLALLLLCVGVLVYLDWRRQGEIDNLHARIDGLPQAAPRTLRPQPEPAPAPAAAPAPVSSVPAPPAPAPERAATQGDVITDPVPGLEGGANGMPTPAQVHPLLLSVMQAHGDA